MAGERVEKSNRAAVDLGRAWPDVTRALHRQLTRFGFDRFQREDIIQEVALRAVRAEDSFESVTHLIRWSRTVAGNLAVDTIRSAKRVTLQETPEGPALGPDVASTVEARLRLHAVAIGLARLSASDRAAILESTPAGVDRRTAVKYAVRRSRARARLALFVEGAAVVVAFLFRRPKSTRGLSAAAAFVVVPALMAWSTLPYTEGHTEPRSPADRHATSVASTRPEIVFLLPGTASAYSGAHSSVLRQQEGVDPGELPAEGPMASTPVVEVEPLPGVGVEVDTTERESPPTLCARNVRPVEDVCIDRPGPPLPVPFIPPPATPG